MRFPPYVPKPVRQVALTRLKLTTTSQPHRECIRRLITDPRMKAVYQKLSLRPEIDGVSGSAYLRDFFRAACDANQQLSAVREEVELARELVTKVRDLSLHLSKTLQQLEALRVALPIELTSPLHLLWNTQGAQARRWRNWRRRLLIDPALAQEEVLRSYLKPKDKRREGTLTAADFRRRTGGQGHVDYSAVLSDIVPHVFEVIQTLRLVTQSFHPRPQDDRLGKVMSRKHNRQAEYVRLFATFLKEPGFSIDLDMHEIIADTATIVLDLSPERILTHDYVRNVLKRP
jgi:hypothetical protein